MTLISFILCVVLPIVIGIRITKNCNSGFLRSIVVIFLVIVATIIGNAFYQHVNVIQSAINLWHSAKLITAFILLFIAYLIYTFIHTIWL